MTTGRVPLEVLSPFQAESRRDLRINSLAAFLTQTVPLEDGSTVKFEIWFVVVFPST